MGFLKKDSDFSSGEHYSVVSAECYFQGTLSVQGSLRVEGTLEGNVDNARHVIVGADGKIKGDVSAQMVVCGGTIEGNVCADMLEVLGPASIKGDIQKNGGGRRRPHRRTMCDRCGGRRKPRPRPRTRGLTEK